MKIHRLTLEEAFAGLQSGPDGLSAGEAVRRLQEFGPNKVEPVQSEPLLPRFFKGFTHFFAVILWLVRRQSPHNAPNSAAIIHLPPGDRLGADVRL